MLTDYKRHDELRFDPRAGTQRVRSGHPGMSLRAHFQPGLVVVQVTGAIEECNAARLNDYVTGLANPDRPLILDLRGVNFINDDGFYALVRIAEHAHRTGMAWALVTSDAVDRLRGSTRSTYRLPVAASMEGAMRRLTFRDPGWSLPHRVATTTRELTRC
ncbi:hypothetical protein BST11_15165 [Mycobacterium alsense]|uniref:STAS domain-containing protein n=1 Tax=Mycobacterium alsense TaxID=324058 RepID=A0AA41XQL3_9MYCO|nr:STAS domain-containing protein [Mycobacterium alsense]MCV7379919.1 STAS domain-containing protein [Mycobacterium alsense]OQZ89920.1 hypothetical protein BST11_15165 [Mycobacterium alsense]